MRKTLLLLFLIFTIYLGNTQCLTTSQPNAELSVVDVRDEAALKKYYSTIIIDNVFSECYVGLASYFPNSNYSNDLTLIIVKGISDSITSLIVNELKLIINVTSLSIIAYDILDYAIISNAFESYEKMETLDIKILSDSTSNLIFEGKNYQNSFVSEISLVSNGSIIIDRDVENFSDLRVFNIKALKDLSVCKEINSLHNLIEFRIDCQNLEFPLQICNLNRLVTLEVKESIQNNFIFKNNSDSCELRIQNLSISIDPLGNSRFDSYKFPELKYITLSYNHFINISNLATSNNNLRFLSLNFKSYSDETKLLNIISQLKQSMSVYVTQY